MSKFKYHVLQHSLTERVFDIGWFPDRISEEQQHALSIAEVHAYEVRVSDIAADRDDHYDEAQVSLKQLALRSLLHMDAGFVLFRSLGKYGPPNRVRSYKGVFYDSGAPRDLVTEIEHHQDRESIIGGLLIVKEPWFEESWNLGRDRQRAVLLLSQTPLSTAPDRALVERVMGALEGKSSVWIDYPRLVAACTDAGFAVLRRGGDSKGTFANLTLFGTPEMLKRFEQEVEHSLGRDPMELGPSQSH
ncbi:MAG: hypothetical protein MPN21_11680 [Thermoanaerobaculia bacterium]|nr:hypothetical protein [Thermoanaerobaculia bacterium]